MTYKVLEFYAGIGGLGYGWSTSTCGPTAGHVSDAFDVNANANRVHAFNTTENNCHVSDRDISRLTTADLDALAADAWLLSPPCQPYSRQGLRRGATDARAYSLLGMLDALPEMQRPPRYLLLENVLGFERDVAFARLAATLTAGGYHVAPLVVNSQQLGIPNSRPRFFMVARLVDTQWLVDRYRPSPLATSNTIAAYLRPDAARARAADLAMPLVHLWRQRSDQYDPVWPSGTRTCCFTKAYGTGRPQGAGSVLVTPETDAWAEADLPACPLSRFGLRFFAPEEMAAMHGFPATFTFPDDISTRQGWRLVGNSLNVAVVAMLVDFMLDDKPLY
ncbi:S-adenosyl-L-methionine-dependent methyltransferase [Blastocladiella britannica]|nr:S-adenosyl-L-methionine-dependent methyltransferase [Blastocladiella britannica]